LRNDANQFGSITVNWADDK